MKMRIQIISQIIIVLTFCFSFNETVFCQDNERDSNQTKSIELDKGCKLILDANMDLTDSISSEIVDGIRTILPKVHKLIPTDSVTIKLIINSEYILPVWGMGGRTIGDDNGETVELYFDPNHPNFKVEYIFRSLVHELHHVGRIRNPNFELTLLECMVNEGLADHFMLEVLNCEITPFSSALTEEQIQQNIIRVKPFTRIKFESWTQEFNDKYFVPWMFGRTGDNPIPHWTGYSIGWKLVENYLNDHPAATASSLVWTPAEIIASSTPELSNDNEQK